MQKTAAFNKLAAMLLPLGQVPENGVIQFQSEVVFKTDEDPHMGTISFSMKIAEETVAPSILPMTPAVFAKYGQRLGLKVLKSVSLTDSATANPQAEMPQQGMTWIISLVEESPLSTNAWTIDCRTPGISKLLKATPIDLVWTGLSNKEDWLQAVLFRMHALGLAKPNSQLLHLLSI